VIIFPVVGCIMLMLLFFFFDLMYYLLLILVIIVTFVSLFFVFAPFVDTIFVRFSWNDKEIRLPGKLPAVPYSLIFLTTLCLIAIAIWIATFNWLVVDCIAWCIGITQLSVIRIPNLKIAVVLLGLFFLYDVFWVFLSPYFFGGKSVMVEVATQLPMGALPMALTIPHIIQDEPGYSLLGLGDIVLPGFFVSYLFSFEKNLHLHAHRDETIKFPKLSYYTAVLIGYSVGFLLTVLSGMLMNKGQPALLYLVPCTLGMISIYAYFSGHLRLMWKGLTPPKSDIESRALEPISAHGDDDDNTPFVDSANTEGELQDVVSVDEGVNAIKAALAGEAENTTSYTNL